MTWLKVNNLSMDIPILGEKSLRRTLVENSLGGNINNARNQRISIRALDNISFQLNTGDRLAILGHNGAGKTSLLRALAGIYKPRTGMIEHSGKLIPLFNMSLGIEPDLTGYENIFIISTFMGMEQEEIKRKIDDIITFTDLGDFIYLPVKTYSAGMLTRLSFAVATSTEPNILLLDEQIGAGDSNFTHKVEKRLEGFYSEIDIIILASHSNQLLKKICNKGMILDKGKIAAYGEINTIVHKYENNSFQEQKLAAI
jgi:ABC-type polysaccharide/polyol phosphate transport system ATPase subunit